MCNKPKRSHMYFMWHTSVVHYKKIVAVVVRVMVAAFKKAKSSMHDNNILVLPFSFLVKTVIESAQTYYPKLKRGQYLSKIRGK